MAAQSDDVVPLPPFSQPSRSEVATAARIVDSRPVLSAYGSVEWDCLHDDGQVWIAAIVREAMRQPRTIPADVPGEVNAFLMNMAERFRERTSYRWWGIRVRPLGREDAMQLALSTYDPAVSSSDSSPDLFAHSWGQQIAHDLVDADLQRWKL